VSEATPLAWYWLFSKTEVLLDCYQRGTLHSCYPVATLLWCKPRQSKRCTSIHFVQSRNCDNLLSSLFIYLDYRCRWKTSMGVTIAQSCVSRDGRENGNMQLLCIPRRPLNICSWCTGKNWKGWKCSRTWGGSLHMMIPTPRPCGQN
jgi:hypothetical protein